MNRDLSLLLTTFLVVLGAHLTLIGASHNDGEIMGIVASSLLIVFVIRMIPILQNSNQ